jgi:hypothetical protein
MSKLNRQFFQKRKFVTAYSQTILHTPEFENLRQGYKLTIVITPDLSLVDDDLPVAIHGPRPGNTRHVKKLIQGPRPGNTRQGTSKKIENREKFMGFLSEEVFSKIIHFYKKFAGFCARFRKIFGILRGPRPIYARGTSQDSWHQGTCP